MVMFKKRLLSVTGRGVGLIVALTLLLSGWSSVAAWSTAQELANGGSWSMGIAARTNDGEHTLGARFTVTSEDGEYIGGCTLEPIDREVPWLSCHVDVPSDRISLVWEELDSLPDGYAPVENPIAFDPTTSEVGPHAIGVAFRNVPTGQVANTSATQTSDLAIVTTQNGLSIYDACYVLVGFSEVGCDDNGDGKITFWDVPLGTYTVHQVADLGSGRSVADFVITVNGSPDSSGFERFFASVTSSSNSSQSPGRGRTSDIAIVTTQGGNSVYDACYVLVDYSEVGCDDNGDGKITFWDIPLGRYIVRQVADLGPGRNVPEFEIRVTGSPDSTGFERFFATVITSAASSAGSSSVSPPSTASGSFDIALITREPSRGNLLYDACYQLLGYSNIGCDDNGDGQITFVGLPPGAYTVHQTQTPSGYPTANDFDIVVGNHYGVPLGYVVKQAAWQNVAGARTVSVVFVDSQTSTKLLTTICAQFIGGSDAACDNNLGDGQIDFIDVAMGTYQLSLTNLPSGWQVLNSSTVTVGSGTGPQFVYVEIAVPGSGTSLGSSYTGSDAGFIAVTGDQTAGTSSGGSSASTQPTGTAVEIILDTSDSMNEQDQAGGQSRIQVAKNVATRLVTETLPAGVPMALRTYDDCSSYLTVPMQPLNPSSVAATIANLSAGGKTPIEQSLRAAGNDLANVSGQKIIVLITDGEETCDGDPKAAIQRLVAQDVNVQVNIVGFAIDNASLAATFRDWASAGNGAYYQASNEIELQQAVTVASQVTFRVIDQQGRTVATGAVGGAPVAVPPGTYSVEIDTAPATRRDNVLVSTQQTTTIDLSTGGMTVPTTGASTSSGSSSSSATTGASSSSSSGSSGNSSSVSSGSAGSSQRTWTAAIWVRLCDAPPVSGAKVHCQGGAGIVVNFSLASGEFLGSCTTGEPYLTPWGPDTVSDCALDGMPFNADIVATQDPSTIPAGYVPEHGTSVVHMGNDLPPFQDGPPFSLTNVRSDSGSTGSPGIPSSNSSGSAMMLMTFRGCVDGFDPTVHDYFANCTIPLDAPDASIIVWGGDGQGGMSITGLDRQYDGAYVYNAGPNTMNLQLSGLAPVVRDAYTVIGADSSAGGAYTIHLTDGEVREVYVFYYFT